MEIIYIPYNAAFLLEWLGVVTFMHNGDIFNVISIRMVLLKHGNTQQIVGLDVSIQVGEGFAAPEFFELDSLFMEMHHFAMIACLIILNVPKD